MKRTDAKGWESGFTLVELLVVLAIIALLATMLMPAFSQAKARAKRVACVTNLRQLGYGFHLFANDHQGRFPMHVPGSEGGSADFVQAATRVEGEFYFAFRHFQALANELGTPQILVCLADTRQPTNNFTRLRNDNVSYFVNVAAQNGVSTSILAGDRNLTNDFAARSSSFDLTAGSYLRWTREMHRYRGNLLYGDSHVEEFNRGPMLLAAKNQPPMTVHLPAASPTTSGAEPGSLASTRGIAQDDPRRLPSGLNAPSGSPTNPSPADAITPAPATPNASPEVVIKTTPIIVDRTPGHPGAVRDADRITNLEFAPLVSAAAFQPTAAVPATESMSIFDLQLVDFLQDIVKWTYLILLLLLLLYLSFRLWVWLRERQERREA